MLKCVWVWYRSWYHWIAAFPLNWRWLVQGSLPLLSSPRRGSSSCWFLACLCRSPIGWPWAPYLSMGMAVLTVTWSNHWSPVAAYTGHLMQIFIVSVLFRTPPRVFPLEQKPLTHYLDANHLAFFSTKYCRVPNYWNQVFESSVWDGLF